MTSHIPRHPSDQREPARPAPNLQPPGAGRTPTLRDCQRVYRFDHGRREHAWGVLLVAIVLAIAFGYIGIHTFSPWAWLAWVPVGLLLVSVPFLFRARNEDIVGIHPDGLLWRPWLSAQSFIPWHRLVRMENMTMWLVMPGKPQEEMHWLGVHEGDEAEGGRLQRVTLVGPSPQSDQRLRGLEQLRHEIITRARLEDAGYQSIDDGSEWAEQNRHIRALVEVNLSRARGSVTGDIRNRVWRRRINA